MAEPAASRDAIQQIMALQEHSLPTWQTRLRADRNPAVAARLGDLLPGRSRDSFARAIEYGQGLVADSERALGETHPDTLASRNNLASTYQDARRLDEAQSLRNRADPRS